MGGIREAHSARGEGEPPGAVGKVEDFEAGEAFHVADDLCVDEDGVADVEERVGVGGKERSRQEDSSPSRLRVPLTSKLRLRQEGGHKVEAAAKRVRIAAGKAPLAATAPTSPHPPPQLTRCHTFPEEEVGTSTGGRRPRDGGG